MDHALRRKRTRVTKSNLHLVTAKRFKGRCVFWRRIYATKHEKSARKVAGSAMKAIQGTLETSIVAAETFAISRYEQAKRRSNELHGRLDSNAINLWIEKRVGMIECR